MEKPLKDPSYDKPIFKCFSTHLQVRNQRAFKMDKETRHDLLAYVIGHPFHCDESGKNTMRLNFSFPSLEQIEVGIKRLAGMIREVLKKTSD
jgi:2-aminoadipate transaminase